MKNGVSSVTVEVGGVSDHVGLVKELINNLLKEINTITGDAPIQDLYQVYKKSEFYLQEKMDYFSELVN